jgi:autotransporter-associated beta strand protein
VDWVFADASSANAIIPQGVLTFAPGVTSQNIRIRLKNDGVAEPIESLILELRSPQGAGLNSNLSRHTLMVGDHSVSSLVLEERWTGSSVYTNQSWSASTPSISNYLTSFTTPQNVADNYSRRLRGQIVAPVTGAYRFWIASDDDSRLFLSSNSSAANKVQIASQAGWTNYQSWDVNASQRSAFINLVAGQSYFMEVQHLEGGGGDHVSVAWEGPGIARQAIPSMAAESQATRYVRLAQSASTRRESDGSEPMLIAILDRPAGTTPVSINVTVRGTAKSGVDYLLASDSLVFAAGEQMKPIPLTLITDQVAESPESIVVSVSSSATAVALSPATHQITLMDDEAPVVHSQILTATSQMTVGTVIGTATASFSPGRSVASWSIVGGNAGGIFAIQSTGAITLQVPGALPSPGSLGLLVRATDQMGASGDGLISIDANPPAFRGVREQRWSGATPYNNQAWTGTTNYSGVLTNFTTAQSVADSYSRRLTGYLRPAVSGNYTFWIASDDASRLFLSTNSLEANKVQIAGVSGYTNYQSWDTNASQKSVSIPLAAGQIYWMEVHHQEGGGGDHASVAWSGPGISREAIPASAIYTPGGSAVAPTAPTVALTSPSSGASYLLGETIVLSAEVVVGSEPVQSVDFFRGSTLIASDATAPYEINWSNAAVGSYAITARVVSSGGVVSSATVSISVASNNQSPVFVSNPILGNSVSAGVAYTGSLAGTATDVNLADVLIFSKVSGASWLSVAADGALSGTPASADLGVNEFTVRVQDQLGAYATATLTIEVTSQQAIWIQAAGGSWNQALHWLNGNIADGIGSTAYFDASNLSADLMVTVDGNRTVGHLRFGDTSPSHSTALTAGTGGSLQLDVTSGQPTIAVANQTATIGVSLSGNKGVVKTGAGHLLLSGDNTLQGIIRLSAGSLILGHANAAGTAAISLEADNPSQGALQFNGSYALTNALQLNGGSTLAVVSGQTVTLAGSITGSAGFAKIGAGELVLSAANSYSGMTSVQQGTLAIRNSSGSATGTSTVTVASGATLSGTGLISGAVSIEGSLVAGGDTVGSIATGALSLKSTPNIRWQVTNWTGAPGAGADLIQASSLQLDSLTQATIVLQAVDIIQYTNQSRIFPLIRTGTPVMGFAPEKFIIDASALPQATGSWAVAALGNDLVLVYTRSNTAPVFASNPVEAAAATEDAVYGSTLASAVVDPDLEENLIYEKISGPSWLAIAANGVMSGIPGNANVGWNEWTVRVTDSFLFSATATLRIWVTNVNDAPTFTMNPVDGGSVEQGQSITASLAGVAQDQDTGDSLTFSKVSGPSWLSVATNGSLSGIPSNSHVGQNSVIVRVTDAAGAWAETSLVVQVINVNDAPAFLVNPIAGGTVKALTAFTGSLAGTASDVDSGDTISYSKISGPTWLNVASDGGLSGSPAATHVGTNGFVVRATDAAGAFSDAALSITVTPANVAPNFLANPIAGASAISGNAYVASLAGTAVDANPGDAISYAKVSGPAWLTVAANGALSGTPAVLHLGANSFIIRATDGDGASAQATLNIRVLSLPLPWLTAHIGTGNLAGSSSFLNNAYTVAGSGLLAGNVDSGHFVYQTLFGDGEIIARVDQLQNTGTSSRVGVMIRNTLASNAQYAAMTATGTGAYRWSRRTVAGAKSTVTNHGNGTLPNVWVRLTRVGNTFTSFTSTNGTTWTNVGAVTMSLPSNCLIGLYVASGSNTTLNTSRFVNVTVAP